MDCSTFAFDLHVLGTPPALILSQDQTLMLKALAHFAATVRLKPDATYDVNTTGLTRAMLMNWLCVVQSAIYEVVRRQSPSHGLTTPVDRFRDATR